HGYVGAVLLLIAPLVRVPSVRRGLLVVGLALVVSDLLHHFAVLWPVTGSPHWDWVYPDEVIARPAPGWLPDRSAAGWALWVAGWAVRVAMLAVVPVSRPPASAAAWLLTIFLFPWLGLLLYLLIGSPRMPRWRRRQLTEFDRETGPLRSQCHVALADRGTDVGGSFAPVARLSRRLGHFPATGGNRVE